MKRKQFIVVTGVDGSGKTTLINALSEINNSWKYSNWKMFEKLMDKTFDPIGTTTPEFIESLSSFTRSALFLYNFGLQLDKIILPALNEGNTVIADSYWYKFTAKMEITKHGDERLLSFCHSLPKPDKIIFIDTFPETALQRKSFFNFYETFGDKDNFVRYQSEIRQKILSYISKNKNILTLSDDTDIESRVALSLKFINE